ncbi:MAG: aminoacetone oxidase family FAD-binding enzyme [Bacteroidales bacterium]|nr:aminoacetone oxidase family FAD-binding enzyme [Bacteroidales bacterium]
MVDVLVIGAGAAGCIAAIKAAEAGASVALLEKNAKLGRKIMITGKGRCNITNAKKWSEFSSHLHPKPAFLKAAFHNFSNLDTIAFFESIGVETVLTRDDRVFPQTMSAATVVDALTAKLQQAGVKTVFSCEVNHVAKLENGHFEVTFLRDAGGKFTSGKAYSRTVIVATGGLSYPATGSTGAGYEIAKDFGHTIKKTFPSLTALVPEHYDTRLVGIELLNVMVTLNVGRDVVACEFGDLQFTDGGLEGPLGFKISRKAVWALLNGDKVMVSIDLKPAVSPSLFAERVVREAQQAGVTAANFNRKKESFLRKFMPQALIEPFVAGNELTLDNLATKIKDWRLRIVDYVGYRRAVVTAGGVSLDEIVSKTMHSRNTEGLYFAGEVLDMDADTGGYNLQIAFSTGALAGKSAAEKALAAAK